MNFSAHSPVLERALEPAGRNMSPEAARWILSIRPNPETENLLDEFAEKNTAGELSDEERATYESLVLYGDLMSILQAKARKVLASANPS